MLAKERYAYIMNCLQKSGAITTGELMEALQVSIETVRRDLLHLERLGKLQRVHGGAVSQGEMQPYKALPQRLEANASGKTELCEVAALLVNEDDIIFVDSGSTAVFFAKALLAKGIRLTVVTHSMDVFEILSGKENFQVILCGGFYDSAEKAFHGHLTLDTLRQLHVGKAFLCPSAISLRNGVWDYHPALVQVQAQVIAASDQVVFLADSDKFEKNAMLKLSDTSARHIYVTDSALPSHIKQIFLEHGIPIITEMHDLEGSGTLK